MSIQTLKENYGFLLKAAFFQQYGTPTHSFRNVRVFLIPRRRNVSVFTYGLIPYRAVNTLHHHHVPEGLGVFPVPWSSRRSWSLHLFLRRPMFPRPFGLYCSACFGNLFVSILCTCCNHFFWYCFIYFTMFWVPVFCLIHWFFSLSSFVIPSKCLKNFSRHS